MGSDGRFLAGFAPFVPAAAPVAVRPGWFGDSVLIDMETEVRLDGLLYPAGQFGIIRLTLNPWRLISDRM